MAKAWLELLGNELVQHNESDSGTNLISTNQIDGKTIALYFSAHWCPPCRNFTPVLAKLFKDATDDIKNKFDIVFVSADRNQTGFDEYFQTMPWKALPFSERVRSEKIGKDYQVGGIPCLIVFSPSLGIITRDGVEEIFLGSEKTLQKWSEQQSLYWNPAPQHNEHVWQLVNCTQCFMKPLVGERYGCMNHECRFNLCKSCLSENKHEHPLVEYFIPGRPYSLEKLLTSLPHLLDPKTNEKIETKSMCKDDIKSIGFYFSAGWYPPCHKFTPILMQACEDAKNKGNPFHIVFISGDENEASFNSYRSEMPWPAAPLNAIVPLITYFQVANIPELFVVSNNGKILSHQGHGDVLRLGVEALEKWSNGEKLARPSADQFLWPFVACSQCNMSPMIGQRYRCFTCSNYDLCSACAQKGHEHSLVLQEQPAYDDEE